MASTQTCSLQITKRMLVRIFTHHQVPMQHMNLLFLFGRENRMTGGRYDSFWGQVAFGQPMPGLEAPDLGRSGKHYEISFNLKGISSDITDPKTFTPEFPHNGAICNVAIYHKLDIIHGTSIWIITKPGGGLSRYTGAEASGSGGDDTRMFTTPAECYISSLEVHITLARWAGESWWAYFQDLETLIEDRTGPAVLADSKETYTAADLKLLQAYLEKASEAVAVLHTNLRILQPLVMFYNKLLGHNQFSLAQDVRQATEDFTYQLQDIKCDFEGQVSRGMHLTAFVRARKELILELMQAHTSDRTMQLSQTSVRESFFMRIVTVVTLLYLPATFVSTLFSREIIRYEENSDEMSSRFSYAAFWRWIQIGLPLTTFTLVATIVAFRRSLRSRRGGPRGYLS
ncbi:hypothetical protein PV08_02424 [Exophiala spinifera]|uniref:CorA-like transporter domain-containing protein n=1 Tax=Exophiala spinifera TaxID=91928 RepID=A0A0D1YSB7_9EURO|nr:uncharacterized protein PV08_02424 [Exophiala spinifera]KIW18136.1 hypothetical protein PV08_02424 [Exophiala spinifera]